MAQIIDDRNPAIVYSPGWTIGGMSSEYNFTTTSTQRAGLNATLTFHGVSVIVFGTIPNNSSRTPPLSSYAIDGYNILIFEPTLLPDWQYHSRFFQSPQLRNDSHTLVVTNLRNDSGPFLLDYFIVETSTSTSSMATPDPTSTLLGDSVRKPHISAATLAGSITAAVISIILAISIIYFLRCRRKVGSNANNISVFSGGDGQRLPNFPINQDCQSPPPYEPCSEVPRVVDGTSRSAALA